MNEATIKKLEKIPGYKVSESNRKKVEEEKRKNKPMIAFGVKPLHNTDIPRHPTGLPRKPENENK